MSELTEEARREAEQRLLANAGPLGLLGSAEAYQQVWSRDTLISSFGLHVIGPEGGRALFDRSLDTLLAHQQPLGNLPHNVGSPGVRDPALVAQGGSAETRDGTSPVVDTAHAGCIDGPLWFVLASYHDLMVTGDEERLRPRLPALARAYRWLRYQDSNGCGLLEVHEAKDWADLFANRYNSLAPNVLWYAATRALARIVERCPTDELEDAGTLDARADGIRYRLNTLLWVGPESSRDLEWVERNRREWLYPIRATEVLLQSRPYYLPYVAFRDWADRFDTFGNLLAVLFGVADARQAALILDHLAAVGADDPWPVVAVDPVIRPGEPDWREYYRIRNLNQPHQYHNGGAWPFLGGFYVAALVQAGRHDDAARQLERLAAMNERSADGGRWGFHEWFHGRSGNPMGFRGQSWSMAMYLYAHEAVSQGACPGFRASDWAPIGVE